ncbi:MAG: hypothetical protein IKA76_03250 [Clostridia bacterium]|nr:hypothetical protein [Clostridia bacterium]
MKKFLRVIFAMLLTLSLTLFLFSCGEDFDVDAGEGIPTDSENGSVDSSTELSTDSESDTQKGGLEVVTDPLDFNSPGDNVDFGDMIGSDTVGAESEEDPDSIESSDESENTIPEAPVNTEDAEASGEATDADPSETEKNEGSEEPEQPVNTDSETVTDTETETESETETDTDTDTDTDTEKETSSIQQGGHMPDDGLHFGPILSGNSVSRPQN